MRSGFLAELGDHNSAEHDHALVSEFRFHAKQDVDMELAVLSTYQSPLCRGLSPAQAEGAYLERCKALEFYGVDMHIVTGRTLSFKKSLLNLDIHTGRGQGRE